MLILQRVGTRKFYMAFVVCTAYKHNPWLSSFTFFVNFPSTKKTATSDTSLILPVIPRACKAFKMIHGIMFLVPKSLADNGNNQQRCRNVAFNVIRFFIGTRLAVDFWANDEYDKGFTKINIAFLSFYILFDLLEFLEWNLF